jgi:hypothetical protein
MSKLNVNAIEPSTGTDITLGASGDTITVPSGATFTQSGTMNASAITAGTVATARLGTGTASSTTVLYGDQTYKAEPSGGLAFIKSQAPTASTTMILTDVFSSTYTTYLVAINKIQVVTDESIAMRWGTSGSADSTADQVWTMLGMGNDGTELRHYSNQASGGFDTFMRIGKSVDADTDAGYSATLWLHNPNTTNPNKMYHGTLVASYVGVNDIAVYTISGMKANTAQFTDLNLYTEGGNNFRAAGTVKVYGVVDS